MDAVRAAALAEIAHRRWIKEVAGVEFNGRRVDTSREARAILDQAARLCHSVPWKFADGSFAVVAAADLAAMVGVVMTHVAACYADEAAAAAAINAAETFEEVQAAVAAAAL